MVLLLIERVVTASMKERLSVQIWTHSHAVSPLQEALIGIDSEMKIDDNT